MKVQTFIHTYCVVFQYMQQLHNMYNVFPSAHGLRMSKSVPIYIYYLAAQSVSQGGSI